MQTLSHYLRSLPIERLSLKRPLHLAALLFFASILFRFCYVFITNPHSHIFSDPGRHWENAKNFFHPSLLGSMDPIMYQVFLLAVRFVTSDNPVGIAVCIGILSALLPWFWYKALKELVPTGWALAGGIAISWMPSLIMIYSYFMQETLLLTLCAAAIWLSLRSLRMKTLGSFAWAAFLWSLASYTRITALPMAGIFLGLLFLTARHQKPQRIGVAAGFFALLLAPACWHSEISLHYCAPFGTSHHSEIMNAAQTQSVTFNVTPNYVFGFGMCITQNRPLHPFSDWTYGARGKFEFSVDPAKGKQDWDLAIARAKLLPDKPYTPAEAVLAKTVSLFFDYSWPDNNLDYWMGWLAIQSRWLILPMFVFTGVLLALHIRKMRIESLVMSGTTMLMLTMLCLQPTYPVEGRYRKPIEPMLIASCLLLMYERKRIKRLAKLPE